MGSILSRYMVGHHHWMARATSRTWRIFVVKVIILNPAMPMPSSAPPSPVHES